MMAQKKNQHQQYRCAFAATIRFRFQVYNFYVKITLAQCIFNCTKMSELLELNDYVTVWASVSLTLCPCRAPKTAFKKKLSIFCTFALMFALMFALIGTHCVGFCLSFFRFIPKPTNESCEKRLVPENIIWIIEYSYLAVSPYSNPFYSIWRADWLTSGDNRRKKNLIYFRCDTHHSSKNKNEINSRKCVKWN